MLIDFIGMPINLGARKRGVELGTQILRKICFEILNLKNQWIDTGDIECDDFSNAKEGDISGLPFISKIADLNIKLRDRVANSLKMGHFPFIAGGDHSLAWGSISAVLNCFESPECFYVDAHGDMNTEFTSESHNVHGMHMSYLLGIAENDFSKKIQGHRCLPVEKVKFIGQRSLDPGEIDFINKKSISILSHMDKEYTSDSPVHVSLDIDVLDPMVAPGTGVPEKNGFSIEKGLQTIEFIIRNYDVRSLDFVEINPLLDIEGKTFEVATKIVELIDKLCYEKSRF